jgi:membrane-associated protease RseP (regulator of RpoE activity)
MTHRAFVPLLASALLVAAAASSQPRHPGWMEHAPFEGRGRIGLQIQPMTPELREHMKAPRDAGVLVVRVEAGSAAAAAGVAVGDIVIAAGGDSVGDPHDLIARVAQVPEGEKLALELVRDGKTKRLEVTPSGAPALGDETLERWLPGVHQGMEALKQRIEDLERRMRELEQRLPEQKPA